MSASKPENLGPDLSAWLDGELPEDQVARVKRALEQSPELRDELEQLRETSAALAGLPRLKAPAELRENLAQAAAALKPARAPGRLRALRWCVRLTAAAAVLGGGILVGWEATRGERALQHAAGQAGGAETSAHDFEAARARLKAASPVGEVAWGLAEESAAEDSIATDAYASSPPQETGASKSEALTRGQTPVLALCFQPRTQDEWALARQVLSAWQAAEAKGDQPDAAAKKLERLPLPVHPQGAERAALAYERELNPAELFNALTELESRIAAPIHLEVDWGQGPVIVWQSPGSAASPGLPAEPWPGAVATPAAAPPVTRWVDGQEPARARGGSDSSRSVVVISSPRDALEARGTGQAVNAAGLTSQPQPASAPQPAAAGAVAAWLETLGHQANERGTIRVWIRLLPVAGAHQREAGAGQGASPP